jgi:hypothetical protein
MVNVQCGVREPPLQCLQQTMYFVDASTYLVQISRRLGTVGVGLLMHACGYPMRQLPQLGALGLQQPLEHPRLSYLSRLNGAR